MAWVAYNASVKQFISDWDTNQFMDIMCKGAEINRIGGSVSEKKSWEANASKLRGLIALSVEEDDEKEKVWTITCVDADGISSKKCQNGKVLSSWELKFKSPEDAKRVEEFLAEFKNNENLRFAGMKDFWPLFLKGDISKDNLNYAGDAWEWVR